MPRGSEATRKGWTEERRAAQRARHAANRKSCSIEDCEGRVDSKGLCQKHYLRLKRHGDTSTVQRPGVKTARPTYRTVHMRMTRTRGKAEQFTCVCTSPAKNWSYTGGCPEEMLSSDGLRYCEHPEHYQAQCLSCHRKQEYQTTRKKAR